MRLSFSSCLGASVQKLLLLLVSFFCVVTTLIPQRGLQAEFYNGREFDQYVSTSIVDDINLFWNDIPPVPEVTPHLCSIRWTGRLLAPKTGTYYFSALVDDGIRVWIGDQLIIDGWELHDRGFFKSEVQMEAGQYYDLKVEYFNALREAEIQLIWRIPTGNNWFERIFGEGHVLINPGYFYLPVEPRDTVLVETATEIVRMTVAPDFNPTKTIELKPKSKPKPKPEGVAYNNDKSSNKKSTRPARMVPQISDPNKKTRDVIEMFIPEHVQFGQAQVVMLESSLPRLDTLAQFLVLNPYLHLKVEGHTDVAGDPEKNMKLSERRAYAVARYLVSKGVDADKITAIGMGGTKPLVKTSGRLYYPENRRVSFFINVL